VMEALFCRGCRSATPYTGGATLQLTQPQEL
jgi:hypothetical protein